MPEFPATSQHRPTQMNKAAVARKQVGSYLEAPETAGQKCPLTHLLTTAKTQLSGKHQVPDALYANIDIRRWDGLETCSPRRESIRVGHT